MAERKPPTKPPHWGDLDKAQPKEPSRETVELQDICARLFSTGDGKRFLALQRSRLFGRAVPPVASEAMLRDIEGQRRMLLDIERAAEAGMARMAKSRKES